MSAGASGLPGTAGGLRVGLVAYAPLARRTGGNLYDLRLAAELAGWGIDCVPIEIAPRGYPSRLLANGSSRLRERLRTGFDLLLIVELVHPSLFLAARRLGAGRRVALVHHLRSSERQPAALRAWHRLLERRFLRATDALLVNSRDTQARALALRGGAPPCVVVHPGADRLACAERRASAPPLGPGPLRVIFVGSVTRHKGLHTLLAAIDLVRSPLVLRAIGDPTGAPRYAAAQRRRAARARGPGGFRGPIGAGALAAELGDGAVRVVPSAFEGFGMTALEACGAGVVPIASARGGACELVSDGDNGFLVEPEAPAALAARLDALASDRAGLARMADAARETARSWPTWRRQAERAATFLFEVHGRPSGAGGR